MIKDEEKTLNAKQLDKFDNAFFNVPVLVLCQLLTAVCYLKIKNLIK